jgi:hypothetical protein
VSNTELERRHLMRRVEASRLRDELLELFGCACPAIQTDSWSPLTRTTLGWLRKRGADLGFRVWDSKGDGGYLWDMAWVSPDTSRRYWLELVAEVELTDPHFDEICSDFYKVLDAKSRLKLFICAPPARTMITRLRDEIDWAVRHQRYVLPDERIAVVLLAYDGRRNCYEAQTAILGGLPRRSSQWKNVPVGAAEPRNQDGDVSPTRVYPGA